VSYPSGFVDWGFVEILEQLEISNWSGPFPPEAAAALEAGKILYAPLLKFDLTEAERRFLSPGYLDGKTKNLSFDPGSEELRGSSASGADRAGLQSMLRRFSTSSHELVSGLCPGYRDRLQVGRTSFRPAEIAGRASSWRKDDTRLHVDAFPSRPLQGRRILRVFTNVGHAVRLWKTGEPFERVAERFLRGVRPPFPGSSWLLHRLQIVKGRRTGYDHFMLGIHDAMKADQEYQSQVPQTEIAFPPGATWACFTDSVSHAALSGQFAFEQTFYLPVEAMRDPERSPLRVLERLAGRSLA
jgi:hypothetical protein